MLGILRYFVSQNSSSCPFFFQVVYQFTKIHQQMAETLVQKYGVSSTVFYNTPSKPTPAINFHVL